MAEKWIDEIEERGEKRGVLKGRKEGRKEGRQEGLVIGQITAYYDDGHDPEFISEKVKKSVSYVKRVLGLEPAAEEG